MRSIRTKFGLVTACILLGLLFVFYLGGRFILVHMIREAEKSIQSVGNDIQSIIYSELNALQTTSTQAAAALTDKLADESSRTRARNDIIYDFFQAQLGSFSGKTLIHLALTLRPDGTFEKGYSFLVPDKPIRPIEAADMQPYLASLPPLLPTLTKSPHLIGVIIFKKQPVLIASSPVHDGTGKLTGFVVIGSLVRNHPLINRINNATQGMQVTLSDYRGQRAVATDTNVLKRIGIVPIFQVALNYYSGGQWHLGDNAFEAVMPIHDILGREVLSIDIRLPRTFSSIANIALGWLTGFIAMVGIVFVLPIFWLQARILLNPLSLLAEQIREIGEHHLDGSYTTLHWPQKDEFGLLARSVNEMIESLSLKTRQLRQIEQRQSTLIAGMPDCLCVFNSQAQLVTVHKQPDYVTPIPGLIVDHPIAPPLFPESDCEALRQAIGEALHTENLQMVLISCREADGAYRHFETRISHIDAFSVLVVFRDVTKEWRERETREQMEERLAKIKKIESLGNLAAGIAHDFNNILSIIQNTLDLVWQNPRPEAHEALSTIRQATGKGATLTRELMTYAGQTQIVFKRDDPNNLILDLEKLMGGVMASNVALELKLTPGLPCVETDPHQFWKVIINLLKNASEAMNGSRGQIRVSTYPFELTVENIGEFFSTHELSPSHGVVFQIDDTGSGMSREVIGRIFEPFFSTKAPDRGLGLSTVFGIVDAHNGGIAINSELGKGTCFRIWLPASHEQLQEHPASAALPVPTSPAPDAPTAPPAPPAQRPCVLLVEDNQALLQATAMMLRSLNVNTLQATTKREALLLFRKHAESVNLILLDAQLGYLDNVRLLATLRMRKPGIAIVIVSGHTEERINEMFASERFDGFLGKPYTRDDLANILNRFATIRHAD
ncbi:MAG: ATP-binding protein [bacterium]